MSYHAADIAEILEYLAEWLRSPEQSTDTAEHAQLCERLSGSWQQVDAGTEDATPELAADTRHALTTAEALAEALAALLRYQMP